MDYKASLNLPKTAFPMKANLPEREPETLRFWEGLGLYRRLREKRADRPRWILHDGPPYANGHIHIGHALNKILKDVVVKSKSMGGYDAIYVPGWDCHGLPIEHQVDKEIGKDKADMDPLEKRRLCREYALKFVNIQREEFKRLGVFGDWENPYLTMSPDYQATIVREFGKFVGRDIVYKGLKPVHWCASCQTALAEAEVEYDDHESPSVYVKFPIKTYPEGLKPSLAGKKPFVVIWTTTPWTLPANLAIALHPLYDYVAVEAGPEVFIVAKGLLDETMRKAGIGSYRVLETFKGSLLEGYLCSHPFIERNSLLLLADYVTLDQGTGCVHTAPGHGTEDYETGLKHGLPIYNPVDNRGKFVPEVEHFGGMEVFQANQPIIEKMRQDGTLLAEEKIVHSYPHCWRCKNPTIFRATEQWFISMDKDGLRSQALENIRKVRWIPPWGEERIYNMIANRPDWCISRQRAWGIPITAFYCASCKYLLLDQRVIDYVAGLVAREGADVWYSRPAQDLLPPATRCPKCGGAEFVKETDILDVW
ncbi:MAG: isoleucine--tRNA ligase, partial [candidate division NC10 bacterium]|nr:isoleucine--tRNA ligase [candidate division NC10 bacterium]